MLPIVIRCSRSTVVIGEALQPAACRPGRGQHPHRAEALHQRIVLHDRETAQAPAGNVA